jgi:tetratricopeptide (TPR) repeat protein
VVALLVTAVVTNRFYYWLGIEHGFGAGVSRLRFPIEGVEFARRVGIGGRPFNCLATGGYLTWMRFPEERVFVDGRLEAFPEQFFRTYFQAMDDPASWPTIEREYHPDYVLLYHVWSNRHPLARYLARGNGWTLVYYDETTSLFLPVTDTNRDVRARAQQEFATLQSRRSREPPRVPGSVWRAVVLPIEEPYRQSAYGDFLRAMGQHTEAIEAYKRALVLDPDDSATRFSLAMAYWFAGNRSQSTLELRDILRRDPRHEHAARALEEAQAAMRRSAGSR